MFLLPIPGWLALEARAEPTTEPALWREYCETPRTRAFGHPILSELSHRRVFTVCVDASTGAPTVSPSPLNRYTHELSFQRPELLLRTRVGQSVVVVADGVPAIGQAEARRAEELLQQAQQVVEDAKKDEARTDGAEKAASTLEAQEPLAAQGVLMVDALHTAARQLGSDSEPDEALEKLAHEADDLAYRVQYLPSFGEGTLPLRVSVAAVNGSAVADQLDALVAELTDSTWSEAAQWTARFSRVSSDLRKRDDLSGEWVAARAQSAATALHLVEDTRRPDTRDKTSEELEKLWAAVRVKLAALESEVVHGDPAPSASYSLQVEGFYNVTFFGGVGLAFGDARDGQWDLSSTDGVDVIVSDGTGPVDPELVIGSTVFLGRKPKTYTGFDFGLSAGVGVLGASEEGLSTFHSLYVGPTVGWLPLSVTLGAVVKTGTHLRDTRAVGQQVPADTEIDDFVEERPGIGWGLMVSLPWAKVEVGKNQKPDVPPNQPTKDGEQS